MREQINGLGAPLTLQADMNLLRRQLERGAVLTPTGEKFLRNALADAEAIRCLLDKREQEAA